MDTPSKSVTLYKLKPYVKINEFSLYSFICSILRQYQLLNASINLASVWGEKRNIMLHAHNNYNMNSNFRNIKIYIQIKCKFIYVCLRMEEMYRKENSMRRKILTTLK